MGRGKRFRSDLVFRHPRDAAYQQCRQDLGRAILLGLELLVAGDIIRTGVGGAMRRRIATIGLLLAAGGQACSITARQIYGRDGIAYQYIQCPGFWRTLDDCYQKANQVCPSGYRIADGVAPVGSSYDSSLIIRCQ